jgi:hypothetical protein
MSLFFHVGIVAVLVFFAARKGFLGEQLKNITVQMVSEKPPEKPKEPDKPKEETPVPEQPKTVAPPNVQTADVAPPKETSPDSAPTAIAASPVAPPPAEIPSFVFDGGRTVQTSDDPVELYKGAIESTFLSKWRRPAGMADDDYIAEVEVAVDAQGRITDPVWKKGSGDPRWDDSVREAVAATRGLDRPPPPDFPARFLVRFDVLGSTGPIVGNR